MASASFDPITITVDDVQLSYSNAAPPVISGFSHRFTPGELWLITGASGSGKSTLLYALGLLLHLRSGTIRWNDAEIPTQDDGERARLRARHIGFVFQDALLDPSRTAEENVREAAWLAGIEDWRTRSRDLFTRFGVAERARHRPGQVSGGQAQRIALCRALVKSPAIILADEPTGNLDHTSADVVWGALQDAASDGATVIVATHDVSRLALGTVLDLDAARAGGP